MLIIAKLPTAFYDNNIGLVGLIAFCKQDITEAQAGLWSNITRSFRSGMGN